MESAQTLDFEAMGGAGSARSGSRASTHSRRALVLSTAATLFRERGFNGAGIDDIGAEAGLTGPAIFHYVTGKQALLAEIVEALLIALEGAVTTRSDGLSGRDAVGRIVAEALAFPDSLAVCLRNLQHLDAESRTAVERRLQTVALALTRHGAQHNRVHLRARAAAGAMISLALANNPARLDLQAFGTDITMRVLDAPLPPRSAMRVRVPREDLRRRAARAFRSEAILAAAARLFHERGFNGVSLSDIGAATGVTGSAVIRRFESKEKLLAAAFARLGDNLGSAFYAALASADDTVEALEELITAYVAAAVAGRDLVCLNLSETYRLPPEDSQARRKRQRAYADELANLIVQTYPGVTETEAKARARVAFVVVSEVINSDELAAQDGLVEDLTTIVLAIVEPASSVINRTEGLD
jgi:AcrR family transcriptional regulator